VFIGFATPVGEACENQFAIELIALGGLNRFAHVRRNEHNVVLILTDGR